MRTADDLVLSYNISATMRLNPVFRESDPEVTRARLLICVIASTFVLSAVTVMYSVLDLPGPAFLWQLILSLCS
ncbi:hypothetical protein [Roseobacter ponti]|uniref:Uncharacterized protein n=1 Tax=Roseobacter ponti TaxID=1891787 RepID=A0A858SSX0_9RHOB|nr:hypothetical protein [Roseobacter ponti]QJF50803.1 hypothetical protein G3256_06350 [Roseobacter ponti]